MKFNKLSIIIPVYNEEKTVNDILARVEVVDLGNLQKEIIMVDDFSTDKTREILKKYEPKYKIIYHDKNKGKGAALRAGFKEATGDIILIQDADLEYDPRDYPTLIGSILSGAADVVYGSRIMTNQPHRVLFFWHSLGNKCLTLFSNILTNLTLTDMETCYKVFTKDVLDTILPELKSSRFGIEPELTAQFAKNKFRIYEVGISYSGRTYQEGKKISWKDGLAAIWHIIRFNLLK
ncbi:MAG: glycosyl transferase [Candidatus Portnoybacteria bacterium CG11_big_fil_rev_8_21_14_0_20_44_10]|uniref:Glycosyl transferase n=1 Tax=Candidatus Portnoybacteria bacterium CG11_big_fil_rev_8_21_14_0_20_44_10 TaxID=1974818 RepID=A0A2H0KQP3_9BACT|nr:MAG: glycosyl transferase [Candidatus Portnoybacteria bacterium CG11_big_fil_rev_8_21_14_0_20_44_10]